MLIGEKLIYLQLQKTGSTQLGAALAASIDGELRGKHEPLTESMAGLVDGRLVIGSVRHPLDWYVSLWGYSCAGRGEIYDRTGGYALRHATSLRLRHRQRGSTGLAREVRRRRSTWRKLYAQPSSRTAFEEWYGRLHEDDSAAWRSGLMHVDYDPQYGLYSHWLTRAYSLRPSHRRTSIRVADDKLLVEKSIRLEAQRSDLAAALECAGYGDAAVRAVLEASRTADRNASQRRETPHYYTDALADTVIKRERPVIDFGNYAA